MHRLGAVAWGEVLWYAVLAAAGSAVRLWAVYLFWACARAVEDPARGTASAARGSAPHLAGAVARLMPPTCASVPAAPAAFRCRHSASSRSISPARSRASPYATRATGSGASKWGHEAKPESFAVRVGVGVRLLRGGHPLRAAGTIDRRARI